MNLANMEGEESFDASMLGYADEIVQDRICDDELILIKGTKARTAASIILRGANDYFVDEMERSVHDALCVVKRVMESKTVVVGGGSVETALSIFLENFATTLVCSSFTSVLHGDLVISVTFIIDFNRLDTLEIAGACVNHKFSEYSDISELELLIV